MENNKKIFDYFKECNNDNLSSLNGTDFKDFLSLLNLYYLELRDYLNLECEDTFGLEIEFEDSNNDNIFNDIKSNWFLKDDGSLYNGGEVTSSTLFDAKRNWDDLRYMCDLIAQNSKPGLLAAGHIHIGVQALGNDYDSWLTFIKLWSTYENVLFRYSYNAYLTERSKQDFYAAPIAKKLWDASFLMDKSKCIGEDDHFKYYRFFDNLPQLRNQAVNFLNVFDVFRKLYKNTIEFRCPNATLNPIIWQNNVNVFSKLLNSCKNDKIDLERIMYRHNMIEDIQNDLDAYRKIYLQQALELSDMIFDNNLDKIYFLRQYIKDFEVGSKTLELANRFTM